MEPIYVRLLIALALLIIFLICGWLDSRARRPSQVERREVEVEFFEALRRHRSR
jgi:hypothetical protein